MEEWWRWRDQVRHIATEDTKQADLAGQTKQADLSFSPQLATASPPPPPPDIREVAGSRRCWPWTETARSRQHRRQRRHAADALELSSSPAEWLHCRCRWLQIHAEAQDPPPLRPLDPRCYHRPACLQDGGLELSYKLSHLELHPIGYGESNPSTKEGLNSRSSDSL